MYSPCLCVTWAVVYHSTNSTIKMPTEHLQPEHVAADPSPNQPKKMSRFAKITLISLGGLFGILLIGAGIAYWLYAGKIQSIITDSANEYIKGAISRDAENGGSAPMDIELGLVDYDFFGRTLTVKDIHIVMGDVKDSTQAYMDINLPLVYATGVNPWDILFGDGLSFGDILIDEPTIYRRPGVITTSDSLAIVKSDSLADKKEYSRKLKKAVVTARASGKPLVKPDDPDVLKLPRIPDIDSLVGSLLSTMIPGNVKPLYIHSVVVNDAAYVLADARHNMAVGGAMVGLNIKFNSISIRDSAEHYKAVGESYLSVRQWTRPFDDGDTVKLFGGRVVVDSKDSSMYIDSVEYLVPKATRTYARGVHISFRQRTLGIDSFSVMPTISDAAVFAKTPYRSDRIRVSAGTLIMKDMDTKGLIAGTALHAHTLDIKRFYIDVLSNSRAKRRQGARPKMPYQVVAEIPFQLGIDSVRVGNTSIIYGELHPNSNTPAVLQFSRISFLVTGLSNDPKVQAREPVKIFGKGAFQKNGVMDLEVTLPLNVKQNTFDAEATLAELDLKTFNSFLPVAENIRVKSGWVKKSSVRLKVRGRQATGVVSPQYIDFELEVLNKSSKKVGFWEGIASFLANWLKIKNNNVPGKDMEHGTIAYTIPADASVFQALWFPIRSGLGQVIGF